MRNFKICDSAFNFILKLFNFNRISTSIYFFINSHLQIGQLQEVIAVTYLQMVGRGSTQ